MPIVGETLEGERVGLFTLDPGRTSGITASTPIVRGTVEETFAENKPFVDQVDCNNLRVKEQLAELEGAKVIAETFELFEAKCLVELGIPQERIFFVYEDFVLRPHGDRNTDRSGLSPVRVTNSVMSYVDNPKVIWVPQSPSDAHSSFPNHRLKNLGLWTVAMEHGRDATKHAALWVRRAAQGSKLAFG